MRAGGCTIQQALTTEAATVVKQSITLARRRGHAQVTPLHVANTMLSSTTGLLKTACLQSHSHPLQTKALELCFNVALNRLPASTSGPMLGVHSPQQFPSISNALVAAFKRAQAHQRRGSIETQQQPVLAVKIELEQLVISILDDPSVSRVMREAGFSSTQVKSNIERAVSLEIGSQSSPNNSATLTSKSTSKELTTNKLLSPTSSSQLVGAKKVVAKRVDFNKESGLDPIRNEDVMSVIENLLASSRRRSFVIVGESTSSAEAVVKGVMDKVAKGDVPETLRQLKFSSVPVSSLWTLSRIEVEEKLEELKKLVRGHVDKGIVLNLGDLNWVMEKKGPSDQNGSGCYHHVEQLIMELGKLASSIGESSNNGRFWVIGMATFQAYDKCKSSHPCLDTVYGLHPLTIPAGILRLSLTTDSDHLLEAQSTSGRAENKSTIWSSLGRGEEARSLQCSTCNCSEAMPSTLPPWLRQHKSDREALSNITDDQGCVSIKNLCNKWNTICGSVHQQPYPFDKTHTSSSPSFSYSSATLPYDEPQYPSFNQRRQKYWGGQESVIKSNIDNNYEHPWRLYNLGCQDYSNPTVNNSWSNPNSTPNSTSSSDAMEMDSSHKFKELSSRNLNAICDALAVKVPWQKDVIPEVASTVLKCRSGMIRRKGKAMYYSDHATSMEAKEETWLFFQGVDVQAKEKIARELARLVFGSYNDLVTISLSNFSSTRADSTEDCRNKRSRDEQSCSYFGRFVEAVSSNPSRVFLVEDVEQADYCSQMGFKRAMEWGKVTNTSGEEVGLGDSIVILSCESFSSRSRACSPTCKLKLGDQVEEKEVVGVAKDQEGGSSCVSLDLNISIEDDHGMDDQSIDDIGLLELVDGRVIFKIHDL